MKFDSITDFMLMVTTFSMDPDRLKPSIIDCSKQDEDFYEIKIQYNLWSIELYGIDFVPFLRLDVDTDCAKKVVDLIIDFINSDNITFTTPLSEKDQQVFDMYCEMFVLKFG